MRVLHIDSSIDGERSVSRRLTAAIVARLKESNPNLTLTYRDVATNPVPQLSEAMWFARMVALYEAGILPGEVGEVIVTALRGGARIDPSARRDLAASDAALEEFLAADVVVLAAPMYNFAIPSQLKAWIDTLAVPGKTFRYSAEKGGVEGLAGGKWLILASTRGGIYTPGAHEAFRDHQETYVAEFFGFMGVTDITVVRAEGVNLGPEFRRAALESALAIAATLDAGKVGCTGNLPPAERSALGG